MKRSLLTPRWLALHVLFLTATTATGFLALWQWERAHEAGGSFQNLGYALMWPLFGVFTLFLWHRLAVLELQGEDAGPPAGEAAEPSEQGEATRKRPLVPPPAAPPDAAEDPELAAYNQYLAELNSADRQG